MSRSHDAESKLGQIIDTRYRLDEVLGTGGFGAVYRARHLDLDHDVAVKLLHEGADTHTAKRLAREAKVLARLDHPNCVRVMDYGREFGSAYLVMELVAGQPLTAALGTPWAPRRVVDIALELLAGLSHAHGLGLVHRDLKPANVLLADRPSDGASVRIIDFGIVTIAAGEQLASFTEQLTKTGSIIGTPRYMSPEQLLAAKVDARSDLYAIGLLLFEMLAGRPAYDSGDARFVAYHHVIAPTPLLPDGVPDELAQLIGHLLAKKPEQRPPSAAHVRERLLALRPSLPDTPSTPPARPREDDPSPASSTAPVDAISLSPQARVGRFPLLRELGRGAMGTVYLAWDEALDRQIAVKLLRDSPSYHRASERMVREARGLARVSHPNVVGVYELGSHLGQMFVAMQYVRGRTLRAWLDERPRAWSETLARLVEAGRGLAAVHAAGLVHRDFRPENLMIGDDQRARVVDFGLVRVASPAFDMLERLAPEDMGSGVEPPSPERPGADVDPLDAKLTRSGAIIGTPAYMALEQLAGIEIDARCDQFAFCVVAYEALFGQRPFVGRTLEDLAAKLAGGHVPDRPTGSTVPPGIDRVLARGLQVVPSSRWPSMDALLDALERAARPRRRATRWLLAIAGLLLAAGTTWGVIDSAPSAPETARTETMDPPRSAPERPPEHGPALDDLQARLARARPDDPRSWRDAIELAVRHRDAMPLSVRAGLHAVAGAMHEHHALRELGRVEALAWSPRGSTLALARSEGGITLWDAEALAVVRTLEHAAPLDAPRFSDDGELLVAREGTQRAHLWHVSTGTKLGEIERAGLRQAVFVARAQQLVIVGDHDVSVWSLVRGRELERTHMLAEGDVLALASADEGVLLMTSEGRAITWGYSAGDVTEVALQGFEHRAEALVVPSPDSRRVALASAAGVALWDVVTGERIATSVHEHAPLDAVAFSPDSGTLAVALRGRATQLLDANTGRSRATTLAAPAQTRGLAFDRAGTQLFVLGDDGRVDIAEPASGHGLESFGGVAPGARSLSLDPTGSWLGVLDEDRIPWVWAAHSVAVTKARPTSPGADAAAPSLAHPNEPARVTVDADGRVVVHPSTEGEPMASFVVDQTPVTAAAVSADASTVATATGSWPARLELWTLEGQRTRTIEIDGEPRALAWSPDGTRLAWAGVGPVVGVQPLTAAASAAELRSTEAEIRALAFSPDGAMLAVGGHEVHLWQLDADFDLATLAESTTPVDRLTFSPDARELTILYEDGRQLRRLIDEPSLLVAVCRANSGITAPETCDPVLAGDR